MSFGSPYGANVPFNFTGSAYSQPSGATVTLNWLPDSRRYVAPPTIVTNAIGAHQVANRALGATAGNIYQQAFGQTTVGLRTRSITPASVDYSVFGATYFKSRFRQYAYAVGIALNTAPSAPTVFISYYRQPSAANIPFRFGDSYTPQVGSNIRGDFLDASSFRQLAPLGIAPIGFGASQIRNYSQGVAVSGFNAGAFGAASLSTGGTSLYPSAFVATTFGAHAIFDARQTINLSTHGFNAFQGFGSHRIEYLNREIRPSGLVASLFGTAALAGGLRYVAPFSLLATQIGSTFVAYRERLVYPNWFVATSWGVPQVGYHQTITVAGFDATRHGVAEVFDNRKRAFLEGFVATQFGNAFVAPRIRNLQPMGFWSRTPGQLPDERWGRPEVYNKRQYVAQYFEVTPYDGGVFGNFNYVENRNRIVGAIGFNAQKFALTNRLELGGRALLIAPTVATAFGDAMIAYRIRYVTTQGADTSIFTEWANVRNNARKTLVAGFVATEFGGTTLVLNTRRYYDRISLGDQLRIGEHFVARRIRSIAPYFAYEGGVVPEPRIQLGTRYVRPFGVLPNEVGAHTLEEKFTIIAPRWVYRGAVGAEARVRNVTPEITTFGYDQTEWGATQIFNRWNYFPIQGFIATLFGRAAVERREKIIAPAGIFGFRSDNTNRISNVLPDPPSPQTIQNVGWDSATLSPGAIVRGNVLFHKQDDPFTKFGATRLINMAIGPCGGIYLIDQFGTPSLNPTQYVQLNEQEESTRYGKPRMSPHTIWARPAPQQAVINHNNIFWHTIDFYPERTDIRPKFGAAKITHRNSTITHFHGDGVSFPDFTIGETFGEQHWISNRRRWVYPTGARVFKPGFPTLNGGGQVQLYGNDSLEFGQAVVENYVDPNQPRRVFAQGLNAFDYGQPVVSNYVRYVATQGHYAWLPGTPRVHPPEPIIPEGYRADVYGETWISNKIRYVESVGADSLEMNYASGSFAQRMRVSERHTVAVSTANTGARIGAAIVSNKVRRLVQAGDIVGAVSMPQVSARGYVALGGYGFDAAMFGDVQRWEAGKVKPHGDDMMQLGYPRVVRRIAPSSIVGQLGAARVARPIRPNGSDWFQSGGAVISHGDGTEYTCGQLPRALAVPPSQHIRFGTATVQ